MLSLDIAIVGNKDATIGFKEWKIGAYLSSITLLSGGPKMIRLDRNTEKTREKDNLNNISTCCNRITVALSHLSVDSARHD